ncbi:NAD(P)/FAD-dependent oxidoreductase [Tomitella cavernea]|uniref:NAD(P)/FAD-dependent oxidoreductase n=1 Tax=Tomitella cavernea TaxID=1387982 RepID=A0ABP9CYC8_9ACTN|nr:FAD-dependent oxidoreductase [Tomitella cavernea]
MTYQHPATTTRPRRVAVIGSGIAGLMAAHVLSRHDHVTLFEAAGRLGGHADTHRVDLGRGRSVDVDTGFIVHNDRTYPNLLRLFGELGVVTRDTDMSMSVRNAATGLEYAGARGLGGLFPTARNLTRPRYLHLLAEVPRFHRAARRTLAAPAAGPDAAETLTAFLARHGFGRYFTDNFVAPLVAAVWSCDPRQAGEYPARYLFTFLEHHGMLTVFGSPRWRTVVGGSARYVEAVAAGVAQVRTDAPVLRVTRFPSGGVRLAYRCGHGTTTAADLFDAAVIAVHPRQALGLLDEPTPFERAVLGAMPYSVNHALLHTDESVLPRARRARASWNQLTPAGRSDAGSVVVTYDLTRLMRLDEQVGDRRFLVTLGGAGLVDPASVIDEMTYEHPIYTMASVAAQARLPELDTDAVAFAGAYYDWGFHEDGAASGLRAAERIGGSWDRPRPRAAAAGR